MTTPSLRVVSSDPPDGTAPRRRATKKAAPKKSSEAAEKPKQKTLAEAIEGGDLLDILKAQRNEIVESLPREKGQAKATLHRLLVDVSDRIAALEKQAEVTSGKSSVVANTANDAWDQSAI